MPRPMNSMVSVAMKAGTLQDRDQHAVDQADRRAEQQGRQDRGDRRRGRRRSGANSIGEDDGDQPVGRADRQVEILVDDDEGHADRHHAVAGGVAQQRVKRVGRAEEGRD